MLKNMSKPGKIFFLISALSIFYVAFLVYFYQSGIEVKDYGELLFLYYTIQIIVLVVPFGLHVFHGFLEDEDFKPIITITFLNIVIYSIVSILFGFFYVYVVDMAEMLADILNGVFLVCVIFWYKKMMG